jgi:YNFM family putative membrane transporter
MIGEARQIAIGLAGFCAFVNLYAPQSVLPLLAREFGASAADASLTITASTLAVALIAPFTGAVADTLGRKRVIVAAMFALVVPTALLAFAPDIQTLVFWRFLQGLVLPPIFAVTVAYIAEEWPRSRVLSITGIYVSASGLGGFAGRFIAGAIADLAGWRAGFLALAVLTLTLAAGVTWLLPRETHFVRSEGLRASLAQMLGHLRNPQLVATYAIGFGVLFTFVAAFTYVNFHLAEPPFNLSATALGTLFVVYLAGSLASPMSGRLVSQFGRRTFVIGIAIVWIAGLALTLVPSLPVIIVGLTIAAVCGFFCQTVSTTHVATVAGSGLSSAVGLYVSWYYVGGSIGAVLPGLIWERAGWPGCVAIVWAVLVVIVVIVALCWRETV